jgi:prepilin-type N-terminal cleavage/methylation domain-containing protein
MKPLTLFFYRWLLNAKQQRSKGFTLLELLISLVVAGIVFAGLLYMVVEVATIDKREAVLDQVQRDMNRAMDYMTDDLQEAVYVYANPERIATQLAADPSFPTGTGTVPILAFWRIDPIESNLPTCVSGSANFRQCQVLRIRQSAYTLVVYVQKVNNSSTNSNWSGQSRIIRYELSKYKNVSTLEIRKGYRDPTSSTDVNAPFEVWTANTANGSPEGSSAVLTDFVQTPTSGTTLNRSPLSDTTAPCRRYGLDAAGNALYKIVPSTATTTANNSFFACVRNPDPDSDSTTTTRANQDIYVFLRGSTGGISGGIRSFSQASSLPISETQILVKGIIDKNLQ